MEQAAGCSVLPQFGLAAPNRFQEPRVRLQTLRSEVPATVCLLEAPFGEVALHAVIEEPNRFGTSLQPAAGFGQCVVHSGGSVGERLQEQGQVRLDQAGGCGDHGLVEVPGADVVGESRAMQQFTQEMREVVRVTAPELLGVEGGADHRLLGVGMSSQPFADFPDGGGVLVSPEVEMTRFRQADAQPSYEPRAVGRGGRGRERPRQQAGGQVRRRKALRLLSPQTAGGDEMVQVRRQMLGWAGLGEFRPEPEESTDDEFRGRKKVLPDFYGTDVVRIQGRQQRAHQLPAGIVVGVSSEFVQKRAQSGDSIRSVVQTADPGVEGPLADSRPVGRVPNDGEQRLRGAGSGCRGRESSDE